MALSDKNQNFRSTPNSGQTWANIAQKATTIRVSLLKPPDPPPITNNLTPCPSVIHTYLHKPGRNNGSFFLDVSSRKEGMSILFQLILSQFPSCRGAAPFKEDGRRYLEVNLDPIDHDAIEKFETNGLIFSDSHRILPIRALPDGSNIIRVSLSKMPFLSQDDILDGLTTTLSQFGKVHDVGIITDPLSKMFLGSGYAIIDITPSDESCPLPPLPHNLPWPGLTNGFHATYTNMPAFCKYCHRDGHYRENCPVARPLRLCYNCNRPGHIAVNCPHSSSPHTPPTPSSPMLTSPILDNPPPIVLPSLPEEKFFSSDTTTSDISTTATPTNIEFADINQAIIDSSTPPTPDNPTTSQNSHRNHDDILSHTPIDLDPPDNHNPSRDTENDNGTTKPNEDRSFLLEHHSSSASKKSRMTVDSFQERLAALTLPSTPINSHALPPSLQARLDALTQKQPKSTDNPPAHVRRSQRLQSKSTQHSSH